MKSDRTQIVRSPSLVGMVSMTKALVLWMMLISGIVLATRQARSTDSEIKISINF